MITNQIKFDEEVTYQLQQLNWSEDGLQARMEGKLPASIYTRLNSSLALMGGEWSKKLRAHLFEEDPRPSVEGLIAGGTLEVVADDFFETPEHIVEKMIEIVPLAEEGALYLEPEAGLGVARKSGQN